MTHSSPNYDARDLEFETAAPKQRQTSTITITPLAVLEACGEIFAEQLKRIEGLEAELKGLSEKLETIERGTKPAARLVSPSGSMIA
jgi:hypothetical protein